MVILFRENTLQTQGVINKMVEEEGKFMEFIGTLDMLPLITDIHQQAESIRNAVLELRNDDLRFVGLFPIHLGVDAIARRIRQNLERLFEPILFLLR